MPSTSERWVCETCAVQTGVSAAEAPPKKCKICEDDRQYTKASGQIWTTVFDLLKSHKSDIRKEEPGLLGVGIDPPIGIGNRALLVQTCKTNVLLILEEKKVD